MTRSFTTIRKTVLAAAAVAGLLLTTAGDARAQSAQDYLRLAQQYETTAAYYERQGDRTTASRYRQVAQLYRELAARAGGGSTPKPTPQPQPQPAQPNLQQQIMQNAAKSREAALNALRTMRPGKNGGYYVYYRRPPIYAGQSYSAEVGPYRFKSYEAVREINRLTNNGNYLTRIGPW